MRYLSICSGIEAASAAWHGDPLNWTPAGFAEIEPFPCAVLAHHYPEVPNLGDMTAPDFLERCKALGPIDVLIGGTPCQAFSVAGLRNSLDDARGNLTLRFVGIVHALRPTVTLYENVPGILNTKDNAFGCFLAGLVGTDTPLVPTGKLGRWTDAGMVIGPQGSAAWRILDAQYFQLAQRRRRCFVVFSPTGGANPAEILFESEGLQRHTDPRPKARKGSAADAAASTDECGEQRAIGIGGGDLGFALRANPSHSGDKGDGGINTTLAILAPGAGCLTPWDTQRRRGHAAAALAPTLATSDGKGGDRTLKVLAPIAFNGDDSGQNFIATEELTNPIRVGQREAVAFQQNTRDEVRLIGGEGNLCGAISAQAGMKQQNYVAAFKPSMGAKARGIGYGGEIRNTVETSGPPPVVQTMQVRRLTPEECEALQGFPKLYTQVPYRNKPAVDGPRYRALGNSMAVPVIRWIGERIQLALDPQK